MGLLDRFRPQASAIGVTLADAPPDDDVESVGNLNVPPRGTSGRGHTHGFLDFEEFNQELIHPRGHEVFDEMYRTDGDVRQVVSLAFNPIVAGTWAMQPAGGENATDDARDDAEFAWWALTEQMEPNLIGHFIEFLPVLLRSGMAPGEVAWKSVRYKGDLVVVPRTIALRLPRSIQQFEQTEYGALRRIKQQLPASRAAVAARESGIESNHTDEDGDPGYVWLNAKDLVYYRLGAEGDNWEGVSLLRPAYKHWRYKDAIERIDAIAQEREALGIPICYPPMGASSEQLDAMEEILIAMRSNEEGYILAPGPKSGAGMAPEGQGWLVEVIGYDRTGSGRDPQPSLEYHTLKISAAFIAEFMRLGHGATGARATAQVQADPHLMSIEAITTVIENTLNPLVQKVVAANRPGRTEFPKLKMSLVDSTSLAQLADFVQKLTQIGALLPDQQLEDFLRARADLPPANPESVRKRAKNDDQLRRDIVMGPKPEEGAPDGKANDKPGKKHGTKTAPGTNPGGRGGPNRGAARDAAEDHDGTVTLAYEYDEATGRELWMRRDPRWYELFVDYHGLDEQFELAPERMTTLCSGDVMALAKAMYDETTPLGDVGDRSRVSGLTTNIFTVLSEGYAYGERSVLDEIQAQLLPTEDVSMLSAVGARARGGALMERATLAAEEVEHSMRRAMLGAELSHGKGAVVQEAAEKAGQAALRRAGHDHAVAAILHGRHDTGQRMMAEDNGIQVVGVRYSAILDRGTCPACYEADDGQVRDFDDPVRLDRMPPNRHCHSTASGHNRCRCFEVYEAMPSGFDPTITHDSTGMPPFTREVAEFLIERGMKPARAAWTADNIAKRYCSVGRISWPALARLGLTRSAACDAAGWMKS